MKQGGEKEKENVKEERRTECSYPIRNMLVGWLVLIPRSDIYAPFILEIKVV